MQDTQDYHKKRLKAQDGYAAANPCWKIMGVG